MSPSERKKKSVGISRVRFPEPPDDVRENLWNWHNAIKDGSIDHLIQKDVPMPLFIVADGEGFGMDIDDWEINNDPIVSAHMVYNGFLFTVMIDAFGEMKSEREFVRIAKRCFVIFSKKFLSMN